MKKAGIGKPPTNNLNTQIIDIEPASTRNTVSERNQKYTKQPKLWSGVRFRCKKLQRMYESEEGTRKYTEAVVENFFEKMQLLCSASDERDLYSFTSLKFHLLKKGKLKGQYAIWLTGNWRLTMKFEEDAEARYLVILDIVDYH
jgi:toxin HigB-1